MISDSSFNTMLRSWRKARLDTGNSALDYPRVNILAKVAMGSRRTGSMPDEQISDAEIFQLAVLRLGDDVRRAFEACHLALIDEKKYNGTPHKYRAQVLGIPRSTYWYRVKIGRRFISDQLDRFLDGLD